MLAIPKVYGCLLILTLCLINVESIRLEFGKDPGSNQREFKITSTRKTEESAQEPVEKIVDKIVYQPVSFHSEHTSLYCSLKKVDKNLKKAMDEISKLDSDKTCGGLYPL